MRRGEGRNKIPYIKKERRAVLQRVKVSDVGRSIASAGELNWLITRVSCDYLLAIPEPFGYEELNEIMGVFESAKQEFYRKVVVPFEEEKLEKNGDVYEK